MNALSLLAIFRSGREEQIRLGEEAIALAGASGTVAARPRRPETTASLMDRLGETEKANELTKEAYRLCRGVGDVR